MLSRLQKIKVLDSFLKKYLVANIFDYSKYLRYIGNGGFLENFFLDLNPYSANSFQSWFKYDKLNLEFCCGIGDFIVQCAKKNKEEFFIGIDYSYPCIQRGIVKAGREELENVAFYCGDGNGFLWDFQNFIFNVAMINFPDPWFKKRHIKRRIVNKQFIEKLSKIIKKDGIIFTVTDVEDLHNYHLEIFTENKYLLNRTKEMNLLEYLYFGNSSSYQQKNLSNSKKNFYTIFQKK